MKKNPIFGILFATAIPVFSALDMAQFHTQSVKTGQPWALIDTRLTTLDIRIEIHSGVVKTIAALEYIPGKGRIQDGICLPCAPDSANKCADLCQGTEIAMDSLETVVNFALGDNSAVTGMHLWVGDVKVEAALQDRATASAQYEDIVRRRKDPALLEAYGMGSYLLRIFPDESGTKRKIEIEFTQGMENSGNLYSLILPIAQSPAGGYSTTTDAAGGYSGKRIGAMKVTAAALDGRSYSLDWPGLGKGNIGASPLVLQGTEVGELKPGILSSASPICAGCLAPWASAEASGPAFFGLRTELRPSALVFEAQPKERIVLLDAFPADPLAADRARKLALLALKAYGQGPNAGNLAMPDGKGGLRFLFPKALEMDEGNLRTAYDALLAWNPSDKADAKAALEAFASTRPAGSPPVALILINNEAGPVFDQTSGIWDEAMQNRYSAFEAEQEKIAQALTAILAGARVNLFGFWNNYTLTLSSQATGGFNMGGFQGWLYFPGITAGSGGKAVRPGVPANEWYLPPLFGPGRPDAWNIRDLAVSASGHAVSDLVVLQENNSRYFLRDDMVAMGKSSARPARALAKTADYAISNPAPPESVAVRLSGRYQGSGRAYFLFTGLWGGLRFKWGAEAILPSAVSADPRGGSIWAYQQSEAWSREGIPKDPAAHKKLGREFHVVNRQLSLLALEPGMDLWAEFPAKPGSGEGANSADAFNGKARSSDAVLSNSADNVDLDRTGLEEILNGKIVSVDPGGSAPAGPGAISMSQIGSALRLQWDFPGNGEKARFRILDVSGRVAADLPAARSGNAFAAEWRSAGKAGIYFLVATSGNYTITRRIVLRP